MEAAVILGNELHESWIRCIMKIGREQMEQFENACEAYVTDLIECNARRTMMRWIYNDMVKAKKLQAIECYDQDTKKKMWAAVKDLCGGRTDDQNKLIDIAKVLYLIEYFINDR
jgi:hypothetical protein